MNNPLDQLNALLAEPLCEGNYKANHERIRELFRNATSIEKDQPMSSVLSDSEITKVKLSADTAYIKDRSGRAWNYVFANHIEQAVLAKLADRLQGGWKSVSECGMPTTGHDCYAAWNGTFWVKASCFEVKNHRYFADFSEKELRRITHYKYVGESPGSTAMSATTKEG
jgi:hypothetical protein